ncbi:MAG: DNA-processing protein DprA [Oscillospiraceae bacterium]
MIELIMAEVYDMRIAIVGSRKFENFALQEMIQYIPLNCSQIISGGANGIDQMAKQAAIDLDIDFVEILPDYQKYGRAAAIKRNEEIASKVYLVLAFWDLKSRGTAHIIDYCIKNYIPFKIIPIK